MGNQAAKIRQMSKVGDPDVLKAKLEKYPQFINDRDKDGNTPLHLDCIGFNLRVIPLLLDRGADINASEYQVMHKSIHLDLKLV